MDLTVLVLTRHYFSKLRETAVEVKRDLASTFVHGTEGQHFLAFRRLKNALLRELEIMLAMAAAAVDMNVTIISTNLDILEQQRSHMHRTVDQYIDKVIDAGRQWTTRRERNHATFLEVHKITSKAMLFLSLKCDEMKSELESETSDFTGSDVSTQQQKNTQMDFPSKPATTHGQGKEDDSEDVRNTHTSRNPNLESDQQSRYQDVYNQLKSVVAKQDKLEQQLNMKLNNLREDTESLKSDVGTFNQYVETGKALLKDYSQKLESLENTVSCLTGNVNEIYSDQQVLVDRINSHLSDKDDQVITDLSAKVDHITTDLTDKFDQFNKDLSANVDQINTGLSARVAQYSTDLSDKVNETNTDLSAKVDQINVVLQSLTNSEKEHAAQINKIIDLDKRINTIEKDTQNNDKQVQQRLDEVGTNLLDVNQKLTDLSVTVETTYAKNSDLGAVGLYAERYVIEGDTASYFGGEFQPPTFIAGCHFNSDTGIFTASSDGIYLAYVSMCLYEDGYFSVFLSHERTFDSFGEVDEICSVQAKRKDSIECSLDFIKLETGDRLSIRSHEYRTTSCRIQFLCFRIG